VADDRDASVAFFTGLLGFEVSDTIEEEIPKTAGGDVPALQPPSHTVASASAGPTWQQAGSWATSMVQTHEFDAVGMAYDRTLDAGLAVFRTLGRHQNERGLLLLPVHRGRFRHRGGQRGDRIQDDWQVVTYQQVSTWGHRRGQGFTDHTV